MWLAYLGAGIFGMALTGKGMIKFYQVVKNRSLFSKRHLALGKYYFGGFESSMSRREAALILNVSMAAKAKKIKESHRTLLQHNHPDVGGSTYLASKLNEAKETLVKPDIQIPQY